MHTWKRPRCFVEDQKLYPLSPHWHSLPNDRTSSRIKEVSVILANLGSLSGKRLTAHPPPPPPACPLTSTLLKRLEEGLVALALQPCTRETYAGFPVQGQHCFKSNAKQKQEIALGPSPSFICTAAAADPLFHPLLPPPCNLLFQSLPAQPSSFLSLMF